MTITYGFYDSVSSDRLYNAKQFGSVFDGIIEDGIYAGLGDKFMIIGDEGMELIVGSGRAWFNHTWLYNNAIYWLYLDTADALLDRIDIPYLEFNEGAGVRANSIGLLTGTPASTPVPPTLTNTSTVHQYPLAHIYVAAGVTDITQDDITNKVGTTATPFVAGIIDYVTTNEILAQWEAQWETWFDSIKGQLDGEAETLLQNQINAIVGDMNPPVIDLLEIKDHRHIDGEGATIPTAGLQEQSVTESKIDPGAVIESKIGIGAVTVDRIGTNAVTSSKLINNAVVAGKIADGAVDTAALANNAVDDAKVGNRVPQFYRRQGGDPSDWLVDGGATYVPTTVRMQAGFINWIGGGTNGSKAVTFPAAFSDNPLIFIQPTYYDDVMTGIQGITTTGFTIIFESMSTKSALGFEWFAIGPE